MMVAGAGVGVGVETEIVRCADDVKTSFPDGELDTVKSDMGDGFGGSIFWAASV
jgi:hypothetical protein